MGVQRAQNGRQEQAPRRLLSWPVVGLFAIGVMRLLTAAANLPRVYNPDEGWNLYYGQQMINGGLHWPPNFNYPSMVYEVPAFVSWWADRLPLLPSVQTHPQNLGSTEVSGVATYFLWRCIPVAFAMLAAVLAWDLARRLGSHRLGLVVALITLGGSYLTIENGYLGTPDIMGSGFVMLALWGTGRWLLGDAGPRFARRSGLGSDTWWVMAMAASALAATSKYPYGMIVVLVVGAALVDRGPRWLGTRTPWIGLGAGLIAAFVSMPGLFLRTKDVVDDMRLVKFSYEDFRANAPDPSWLYNTKAWAMGFGAVLVLAAIAAYAAAAGRGTLTGRRDRRLVVAMLAVYPVLAFVVNSVPRNAFDRNFVPSVAPMAILAAIGTTQLVRRGVRRSWDPRVAAGLALCACVPMVTVGAVRFTRVMSDPRADAAAYIASSVPAGSTVATEHYAPVLPLGRYHQISLGWTPQYRGVLPSDVAAIVLTKQGSQPYRDRPELFAKELAKYQRVLTGFCLDRRFDSGFYWAEVYRRCSG